MIKKVGHGTPVTQKAPATSAKKSTGFKALAQKVTTVAKGVGFGAGFHDYSKRNPQRGESKRAESLFHKTTSAPSRTKIR